jgi:hypothetical protein
VFRDEASKGNFVIADQTLSALELLEADRIAAIKNVERLTSLIEEISPATKAVVEGPDFWNEKLGFEWLIGGQLAKQSVSMLVADPGLGKTTLMAQMTLSLSTGRSFLGSPPAPAARTLLIQAEGSRGAFQGRWRSACEAMGIEQSETRGWFIQADGSRDFFRDFEIGSRGFERVIEQSRAQLVILDTIGFFAQFNENDPNEWREKVMKPLRRCSIKTGVSFVLVHHQPKITDSNRDNRDGRGTSAMLGDCDHFWRLERVKDEQGLRDFVVRKNKYGTEETLRLSFDLGNAIFRPANVPIKEKP